MIIEHKQIDLFGKMLFETATIVPPFSKPNPMPNEACYLHILEGEYTSISETERLHILRNEALLMKCGNYLSRMIAEKNTGEYQAVAVHFFPEVLQKVYRDEVPEFMVNPNKVKYASSMTKVQTNDLLRIYMETVLLYFRYQNVLTEKLMILKLKELILLLLQTENAPAIREIFYNLFSPREYSFKEIIEAHLYSDISVKELAQLCNISLSSFKRHFRKIYGESPGNYLRTKKLEKAAHYISLSSQSLTEIAYLCGFNDSAQFSKLFKKAYGVSPSSYRLAQINK